MGGTKAKRQRVSERSKEHTCYALTNISIIPKDKYEYIINILYIYIDYIDYIYYICNSNPSPPRENARFLASSV